MWTIKIDYATGSSFHNEDISDEDIGYCWENVENAKLALENIKEVTEYDELTQGSYWGNLSETQRRARVKKLEKRPWFNKEYPTYSFKTLGNEGKTVDISVFWIGYFETLHEARVVAVEDESMVFNKRGW